MCDKGILELINEIGMASRILSAVTVVPTDEPTKVQDYDCGCDCIGDTYCYYVIEWENGKYDPVTDEIATICGGMDEVRTYAWKNFLRKNNL